MGGPRAQRRRQGICSLRRGGEGARSAAPAARHGPRHTSQSAKARASPDQGRGTPSAGPLGGSQEAEGLHSAQAHPAQAAARHRHLRPPAALTINLTALGGRSGLAVGDRVRNPRHGPLCRPDRRDREDRRWRRSPPPPCAPRPAGPARPDDRPRARRAQRPSLTPRRRAAHRPISGGRRACAHSAALGRARRARHASGKIAGASRRAGRAGCTGCADARIPRSRDGPTGPEWPRRPRIGPDGPRWPDRPRMPRRLIPPYPRPLFASVLPGRPFRDTRMPPWHAAAAERRSEWRDPQHRSDSRPATPSWHTGGGGATRPSRGGRGATRPSRGGRRPRRRSAPPPSTRSPLGRSAAAGAAPGSRSTALFVQLEQQLVGLVAEERASGALRLGRGGRAFVVLGLHVAADEHAHHP